MLIVYTYKFTYMLVMMHIVKCQYCQRTRNKLRLMYPSGYDSLKAKLVHHRQWGRPFLPLGTSLACTSLSLRGTCTFLNMETSSSYAIKMSLLCRKACMQRHIITFDSRSHQRQQYLNHPRQSVKWNSIHNYIWMPKRQETISPCFTHASMKTYNKRGSFSQRSL